jgi:hypothetical protein
MMFGSLYSEYKSFNCVSQFSDFAKLLIGTRALGVRSHEATLKAIEKGRGINWINMQDDVQIIQETGLFQFLVDKQSWLKQENRTLSAQFINEMDRGNQEWPRLNMLLAGCPQIVHEEFQPNNGNLVKERSMDEVPHMQDTILVHLADEYRNLQSVILPLSFVQKQCEIENMIFASDNYYQFEASEQIRNMDISNLTKKEYDTIRNFIKLKLYKNKSIKIINLFQLP